MVYSEDITIDPWRLRAPNNPFEDYEANVGDTITFVWPAFENHTVFINPTRNCDDTGAIFLGDTSPTSYTFTAADGSASMEDDRKLTPEEKGDIAKEQYLGDQAPLAPQS